MEKLQSAGSGVYLGPVLPPSFRYLSPISLTLLFDDDATFTALRSDLQILQHNIRVVWSWLEAWTLPFNTDTCVHLSSGQQSFVRLSLHNDAPIGVEENTRDLRVLVTTNFKPSL